MMVASASKPAEQIVRVTVMAFPTEHIRSPHNLNALLGEHTFGTSLMSPATSGPRKFPSPDHFRLLLRPPGRPTRKYLKATRPSRLRETGRHTLDSEFCRARRHKLRP
jgi:hypothetical protein